MAETRRCPASRPARVSRLRARPRANEVTISVPGMDRAALEQLVAAAHEVCPYSNATRGNINVALTVA